MVGKARKFVERVARNAARLAFNASLSLTDKNKGNWFIGEVSQDKTKITHPDGTVYKLQFSGDIQQFQLACKVTNDTVFAPGTRSAPTSASSGGKTPWFVIGSAVDTGFTFLHPTRFPEFNIVNGSNFTAYRIPKELLPGIYIELTTPLIYDGTWKVVFSNNLETLVMTRIVEIPTTTTNPLTPPLGTQTNHFYGAQVYYAIATGVTFSNNLVSWTKLTEGNILYPYTAPLTDINLAPTGPPPFIGSTFIGWINPLYQNVMAASTFISFNSSGSPIIDIIGVYDSQAGATAEWNTGPGVTGATERSGLWQALDIINSGTVVTNNDGLSSLLFGIFFNQYSRLDNQDLTQPINNISKGYRDNAGTSQVAFANQQYSPSPLPANFSFLSPYSIIKTSFGTDATNLFIFDATRSYQAYNTTTNWSTSSHMIKPLSTGNFLEFSPSDSIIELINWTYNSIIDNMVKGVVVKSIDVPLDFSVLGQGGSFPLTGYLDWIIVSN